MRRYVRLVLGFGVDDVVGYWLWLWLWLWLLTGFDFGLVLVLGLILGLMDSF